MGRLVDQDRREAARQEREQFKVALRNAARVAFLGEPYAAVTLNALAARAGVPEGTASMLLGTREELFLELFAEAVTEWVSGLAEEIDRAAKPLDVEAMSRLLAATLAASPALPRLAALLPSAIEAAETDPAPVWRLATRLRDQVKRFQELVAAAGDARVASRAGVLPFYLLTLLGALAPVARPVAGMATVLSDLDLSQYSVDLETELASLLAAVLR